jgi:hypothetical protein
MLSRLKKLPGWSVAGCGARITLLLFFAWLTGRFWHPYYGFTRFLQCDPATEARQLPVLRDAPVFVHPGPGGYDGFYYAEIATDPSARAPALRGSVDDLGYRARRILLSALAWGLGRGDPIDAVRAYAGLNLGAWLGLAALLWRLWPARGWRETAAWAGVLFCAGAMLNVRLALTDLTALALLAGGMMLVERGRSGAAVLSFGLAGLARETALLGSVALWPARGAGGIGWARAGSLVALTALPLALWLGWLVLVVGSSGAGLDNFALPGAGWIRKAGALLAALRAEPGNALVLSSVLGQVALSVQLFYVARYPARNDPWWRLGACYSGLLLLLGPAVWGEDLPGAAVRVLLPLTLAFNVLAVRRCAAPGWFAVGNLGVVGGVVALWLVPTDPREFVAGRGAGTGYVVRLETGWHDMERGKRRVWIWSAHGGSLVIDTWPRQPVLSSLRLGLRAITPREIAIQAGDRELWRGMVGERLQWVELRDVSAPRGRRTLRFVSPAAPVRESAAAGARELGLAIYGVELN